MRRRVKCYICGTEFNAYDDLCPCCEWFYLGYEDKMPQDEYNSENFCSINEAKSKVAAGLTIYGDPLKRGCDIRES